MHQNRNSLTGTNSDSVTEFPSPCHSLIYHSTCIVSFWTGCSAFFGQWLGPGFVPRARLRRRTRHAPEVGQLKAGGVEWTGVETSDRQPEGRTMQARGGLTLPGRIHEIRQEHSTCDGPERISWGLAYKEKRVFDTKIMTCAMYSGYIRRWEEWLELKPKHQCWFQSAKEKEYMETEEQNSVIKF